MSSKHADSVNLSNAKIDYHRDMSENKMSQKTSLNLTVDNQLDQLSMNFGNNKKQGNELRDNSMDQEDFS